MNSGNLPDGQEPSLHRFSDIFEASFHVLYPFAVGYVFAPDKLWYFGGHEYYAFTFLFFKLHLSLYGLLTVSDKKVCQYMYNKQP